MKKDNIVQFVGFTTGLETDEFTEKWEQYAKRLKHDKTGMIIMQQTGTKNRFNFVSKHEWTDRDFQFSFMNQKRSEHFPEHNVKVVQMGGYLPIQVKGNQKQQPHEIKVMAFMHQPGTDLQPYKELSCRYLNIYQAYYESCLYESILEFSVPASGSHTLLEELKKRAGIDTGIYKECFVAQVV